jgi:polyhydroxyalkanoate synthesis repressor PhaR
MDTPADKIDPAADKKEPVVIKKYANRRLYNTETSTYVTLDDLAAMVKSGRDFVVFDAKTGDDLTHAVLTQIIVEQENRTGGQTLLPIPFLRQLIRFYGDSVERMVPSYLQVSLETLAKEQDRFRKQFYRPDVIQRLLEFGSVEKALEAAARPRSGMMSPARIAARCFGLERE